MSINWSAVNWGSVADWVSGVGSLSAAVVALHLARWSQSIRFRGYCGLRLAVGGGGPREELVFISVTNIGTRSTVISNLGMRVGLFKKRFAIVTMQKDFYSVGIPYPLGDGQEAHWAMPLDEKKTWLRELCEGFVVSPTDVRTLRFQIHTTHGETFNIRPEQPLREALLAIVSEKVANPAVQGTLRDKAAQRP